MVGQLADKFYVHLIVFLKPMPSGLALDGIKVHNEDETESEKKTLHSMEWWGWALSVPPTATGIQRAPFSWAEDSTHRHIVDWLRPGCMWGLRVVRVGSSERQRHEGKVTFWNSKEVKLDGGTEMGQGMTRKERPHSTAKWMIRDQCLLAFQRETQHEQETQFPLLCV